MPGFIVDISQRGLSIGAAVRQGQRRFHLQEHVPAGRFALDDDVPITSRNDLLLELEQYQPGEKVRLTIYRNGKTLQVDVTLGQQ